MLYASLINFYQFTQCSPKVSPGETIFISILAINISYYRSLRLPIYRQKL